MAFNIDAQGDLLNTETYSFADWMSALLEYLNLVLSYFTSQVLNSIHASTFTSLSYAWLKAEI